MSSPPGLMGNLVCAWYALGMRLVCAWYAGKGGVTNACMHTKFSFLGKSDQWKGANMGTLSGPDFRLRHEIFPVARILRSASEGLAQRQPRVVAVLPAYHPDLTLPPTLAY